MVNKNNQIKISAETRRSVFNKIMSHADFMGVFQGGNYEDQNIVDFLKMIWDLPAMPSEDPRFKNAEADAIQHLVNNDDWDLTYTFEQRFNLLAGEIKHFIKFVEACVSPFVRSSYDEIMQYVKEINPLLNRDNCELAIEDYIDDKPHFLIKSGTGFSFERKDINSNRYTIYVDKPDNNNKSCFFLESIIWDDYGHKTSFKLYYVDQNGNNLCVGKVKICKKNENKTLDVIPMSFLSLDSNYCSLGQATSYYSMIKRILGEDAMAFLYAMKDAAAFSRISDDFVNDSGFRHSLLRDNSADTALNLGRYVLAGFDPDDRLNFTYKIKLAYAPDYNFNIKFDFGRINQEDNFNRVIAIIGENGVGKTSLLFNLAKSIANQQKDCFIPHNPLFTKVVAASYSMFDKFYDIDARAFNFEYCGMHNNEGGLMNLDQLKARHKRNAETINALNRGQNLKEFLDTILPKDMLESLFENKRETTFKYSVYEDFYGKMSSGQTMLTNLIIDITANVRSNCLIMIDEPEVHLHPNAITQIINVVNLVCDRFSSCCIMATHSPLVIQSLLSRNVLIMERDIDGIPVVRQMRVESLGENLTTINEEIFSNGQRDKYYRQLIKKAVEGKESMEQVLQELQNGDLPMSLTSYMLIDKYLNHD